MRADVILLLMVIKAGVHFRTAVGTLLLTHFRWHLDFIDVDTNQERITELFTDVQRKKHKTIKGIQVHIDSREKKQREETKTLGRSAIIALAQIQNALFT